jgi:hypothetical protein
MGPQIGEEQGYSSEQSIHIQCMWHGQLAVVQKKVKGFVLDSTSELGMLQPFGVRGEYACVSLLGKVGCQRVALEQEYHAGLVAVWG